MDPSHSPDYVKALEEQNKRLERELGASQRNERGQKAHNELLKRSLAASNSDNKALTMQVEHLQSTWLSSR
jgi:cell shape-determining protein MreC